MLSLLFCREDSVCDMTYWVAKHYQGFSPLASPWGLISAGGEPQFPLEEAKHHRFPSY